MRLTLPLRVATAMKAGVIEKRSVTRKGKKGKVRRTVLEPRTTVSFGSKVNLGGRLVNRAGHPLTDAKVLVYSRPKEGTEQLAGTVTTDANGGFTYPVEARASQSFRFVYPGTATILPIEPLAGAEEWDNEVCWTSDDIETADQTVAAVFYKDVEIVGQRQ